MALRLCLQFLLVALAHGCNQTTESSSLTEAPVIVADGTIIPNGGTFTMTSSLSSDVTSQDITNTVQCKVTDVYNQIISVNLTCGATGVERSNNNIFNNVNTNIDTSNSNVGVFQLKRAWSGQTCVCLAVDKSQCYNKTSSFVIKYPSKVTLFTVNGVSTMIEVPAGTNVTLDCKADGNPNDMRIVSGNNIPVGHKSDTSNLTVKYKVSQETAGIFKCTATDVHAATSGPSVKTVEVRVSPSFHRMPKFTANSQSEVLIVEPGTPVVFKCEADGYPNPYLIVRAKSTGNVLIESSHAPLSHEVKANKVAYCNSTGVYECSITNENRVEQETLELRVTCGNGVAGNDFELVNTLISALMTGLVMKIKNL